MPLMLMVGIAITYTFSLGKGVTCHTYSGSIPCRSTLAVAKLAVRIAKETGRRGSLLGLLSSPSLPPALSSSLWKPRARISLHTVVKPRMPARWRVFESPSWQLEAYRSGLSISKAL